MTKTEVLSTLRALTLTALLGGCGLISSDITTINFALPERSYTFDTAQAGWNLPAATLPAVACADAAACCPAAMLAGVDCARVTCEAGACALTVTVETPPQSINLRDQAPELSSIRNQSVVDITIGKITYAVTRNTLNVDLPPFELFVAPDGTTSTSSPDAKRFGTVPVIPAGTTVPNGDVAMDPAGQRAFEDFAHDFGTPFVFLGRTTVIVPGGSPIPMGAVDITIKGQLRAKPGL